MADLIPLILLGLAVLGTGMHHRLPVSAGDEFSWGYQDITTQGGNGALEAQISTECSQESGDSLPGIYAEYFDNEGISFNTATMP